MSDKQNGAPALVDAKGTKKAVQPSTVGEDELWDEKRLEEALKTLKEMHIQLRGLRTTIPRLLAPLSAKQPSPETLVQEFSKSTKVAMKDVQDFRQLMTADNSNTLFAHASKSRKEYPRGIKTWNATDHPDWLTREI